MTTGFYGFNPKDLDTDATFVAEHWTIPEDRARFRHRVNCIWNKYAEISMKWKGSRDEPHAAWAGHLLFVVHVDWQEGNITDAELVALVDEICSY